MSARADHPPPRYSFSLDDPPEQRWDRIGSDLSSEIKAAFADVTSVLKYKIGLAVIAEALTVGGNHKVDRLFPGLGGEIRGLAAASNVSVGDLAALSLLYDLTDGRPACTGIIAQTSEGRIIHGRNFDYDFTDSIKSLTILVDVTRGNETLYTGTAYAGLPSFATAVRRAASKAGIPHCTAGTEAFSFEVNERDDNKTLWDNWKRLIDGQAPASQATYRRILEEACTFEDAVHLASTLPLPAPCYFIIAGAKPGQAAVISRGRDDGAGPAKGIWRLDQAIDGWFLIETNYDHWGAVAPKDNRREVAIRAMNDTGGPTTFSVNDMWRVMSDREADTSKGERPVYNNITVFTVVMQAAMPEEIMIQVRGKWPGGLNSRT